MTITGALLRRPGLAHQVGEDGSGRSLPFSRRQQLLGVRPTSTSTHEALRATFPHEKRGARSVLHRGPRRLSLRPALLLPRPPRTIVSTSCACRPLRDVLAREFKDRKLQLLLSADCAHWGSPPSRTSFVFDSMLRLSYFLGNYYPEGGSQVFADDLARIVEEHGGDILMRSMVERIVVENGTAVGVDIATGLGEQRRTHPRSRRTRRRQRRSRASRSRSCSGKRSSARRRFATSRRCGRRARAS